MEKQDFIVILSKEPIEFIESIDEKTREKKLNIKNYYV
jgi:hypothetical protein